MSQALSAHHATAAPRGIAPWPHIGLALATLLWAGNFIAGRALREDLGALELNIWRWAIALGALLPFTASALWRQRLALRQHAALVVALGVTGVAVPHACIYAALQTTSAVNALLLLSLTPVLIMLGAWAVFRQRIRIGQWLGMGIALAGAVTLIARGSLEALASLQLGSGDLWMLPAIVAAAAQALLLKRSPAAIGQAPLLTASVVAALALMVPCGLLFADLELPSGRRVLASLAYVGILASAVAFLLWNRGVARVGPSRAASYLYLMPMYGSVLSALILGEPVQEYQYSGGTLVLLGLWLASAAATRGAKQ